MVKKLPLIRAAVALAFAAPTVFLGMDRFSASPGGAAFDRLLRLRPPVSAPGSLLLVDTGYGKGKDGAVEPGRIAQALLTLTELEAGYAVVQVPIALRDADKPGADGYLERRFNDEFRRIKENTQTLFDAIRMGSIRPQDAGRYVGDLGALVEAAKGRLLTATLDKGDAGAQLLEQAAEAFGRVRAAEDLSGAGIMRAPAKGIPGTLLPATTYSRVQRDADGALRRIRPLIRYPGLAAEHVAYAALRDHAAGRDFAIDPEEPLILELPTGRSGEDPFRKITLEDFDRYEDAEQKFYADLKEMERSEYFAALDPLAYPTTLYEYALSLRAELLLRPTAERIADWREGRRRFYAAAEAFLSGPSEAAILSGYADLAKQEALTEDGRARLEGLAEIAGQSFEWARSSFRDLSARRELLDAQVRGSFIVFGPLVPEGRRRLAAANDLGDTEASAVLVSTLLSDSRIRPASDALRLRAAAVPAAAAALITAVLGPAPAAIAAAGAALLCAAAAALLFIRYGIWLHPALSALGIAAAAAASVAVVLIHRRMRYRALRRAFAGRVTPEVLARRAAAGRKIPGTPSGSNEDPREPTAARAAILAIRLSGATDLAAAADPVTAARNVKRFREETAAAFRQVGGAVLWADGDLVFIAFGSPLDAPDGAPERETALKACREALAFLERESAEYRIGIDLGDCVFDYTTAGGYAAYGTAAVDARVFSGLGAKYGARVVVGKAVADAAAGELQAVLLDALVDKNSGEERPFYGLIAPPPA